MESIRRTFNFRYSDSASGKISMFFLKNCIFLLFCQNQSQTKRSLDFFEKNLPIYDYFITVLNNKSKQPKIFGKNKPKYFWLILTALRTVKEMTHCPNHPENS